MSTKPIEKQETRQPETGAAQLYTLEVFIISGPITEKFPERNPIISRTIKIRGNQTLEDLHHAIFKAFGRLGTPHV